MFRMFRKADSIPLIMDNDSYKYMSFPWLVVELTGYSPMFLISMLFSIWKCTVTIKSCSCC